MKGQSFSKFESNVESIWAPLLDNTQHCSTKIERIRVKSRERLDRPLEICTFGGGGVSKTCEGVQKGGGHKSINIERSYF